MGKASSELFAQFFTRIYKEIPNCILAEFSTLKILQAPNFSDFRGFFRAKLESLFLVPANTFDNVKGDFPIGFFIWDTTKKEIYDKIIADVYDSKGNFIGTKGIPSYDGSRYISDWLEINSKNNSSNYIGHLASVGNDFQNQRMIFIDNEDKKNWKKGGRHTRITAENLIVVSIFYAVRKVIPATWLNDRDQFLYPNDYWIHDEYFQSDCLTYTIFSTNVRSDLGINHWIPFTEEEVNSKERYSSDFMIKFINNKLKSADNTMLFKNENLNRKPLQFSDEALSVFSSGRELWEYYNSFNSTKSNASLYDIKEFFQGRNNKGRMNSRSTDKKYTDIINELRKNLYYLARKIEPKVYEYGFLIK
jgi:hypothetical protein